jgi:hypothetical protein
MNRAMAERKVDELVHLARCWCEASAELREQAPVLSPSQSAHLQAYIKYLDAQISSLKRQNLADIKPASNRIIPLNARARLVAVAK